MRQGFEVAVLLPNRFLPRRGCLPIFARVSEHTRFLAPARLIALLTSCSRVLGLVREAAFSYFCGIDPVFSSFRVAFMVPNLARRLFGEGAMASAFIPVFTEALEKQGRERARELAGSAFTLLGAILCGLTLLVEGGILIAHLLHRSDTLSLTMVMLPYMILICLAGFAGGMLNALNRFALPAAAPMLLNIVLIALLLIGGITVGLEPRPLVYVVAVGVVLSGLAQFGLQLLDMRWADCSPTLNLRWRDPDLRRILLLLAPMLVGLSATQLNVLADNLIALYFVPQARGPAVLGYAHMLYHLPLGVFGIALATAIFPQLSARAAQADHGGLARALESGVRVSLFIALPASVGLIMLATPIVALVYQHRGGRFGIEATDHVARTLVCYCLGLWAFSLQPILARAFYALQDARTPVRIGVITVSLNLVLSLVLVFPMAEGGIALATAAAACLQVVWLVWALRRRLPEVRWSQVAVSSGRTALAVAAMSAFLWWISGANMLGGARPAVHLAIAIPGGIVLFAVAARGLRCPELLELLARRRPSPNAEPSAGND